MATSGWDVSEVHRLSCHLLSLRTKYLDIGCTWGTRALVGGKRYGNRGYFFEPAVLVDTLPTMQVVQEEIFGPVVTAMPFEDLDDLTRVANDTVYGLAAGV